MSDVPALGLEVRAGVHTGECERLEGKLAGIAVAVGARIASMAKPGESSSPEPCKTSSPAHLRLSRTAERTN